MWYEMLRIVAANLFGCFLGAAIAWFLVNKFTDWQFYQFAKRVKFIGDAQQKIQQEIQQELVSSKFKELIEKVKEQALKDEQKQRMN